MIIKTIDLLNKIESNEDIPEKIKYKNEIWEYSPFVGDYCTEDRRKWFISSLNSFNIREFLSFKIEVIEEEEKIKKIIIGDDTLSFPNGGGQWTSRKMDKALANKINELINEVNKLKEND